MEEEQKGAGESKKGLIIGIVVVLVIALYLVLQNTKSPVEKVGEEKGKAMMETGDVREFSMTSYYDEQGKWFSLKEISVKKGDKVRIKVTNTKGTHDFTLDEYGIKKMTPLNEEVVVEFTADKVGEFTYYCSTPGHRAGGQFGKLVVTE